MAQASIPQGRFNAQQYIANSLSDKNMASKKEFLAQGAKDMHHVADTVKEWYQGLEPGQFTLWYQALADVLTEWYNIFSEWITTPEAIALGMTWLVVYFIVFILVAYKLGFGVRGVIAGSLAAWWQSYAYGAFTPLGGVFAFLTSMAMMGRMQSVAAITGIIVATIVTVIVWAVGVGGT